MALLGRVAGKAAEGLVRPFAGAIERVLVARQVTEQTRIQADARIDASQIRTQARTIELAMTANGLAGLWYPLAMIVLTGLFAWAYVQTFATIFALVRIDGPLTEDDKFLLGQLVALCAALTAAFMGAGGFARWRDTRLRERGIDDREGVSDKLRTLEQLRSDATPAPAELLPPIHRRTGGITAAPEILAERRAAAPRRADLDAIAREIEADEGRVHRIYPDPKFRRAPTYAGKKPTYGVGHLMRGDDPFWGKPFGTAIPEDHVEKTFRLDLHQARSDARHVFPGLDTLPRVVQHVLINASFQLGRTKLARFTETRKAVAARDWAWMAAELRDSDVWRDPLTRERWEGHAQRVEALIAPPDPTPSA